MIDKSLFPLAISFQKQFNFHMQPPLQCATDLNMYFIVQNLRIFSVMNIFSPSLSLNMKKDLNLKNKSNP